MNGQHLTADLYECACPREHMTKLALLKDFCTLLVKQVGLTRVDDCFFAFPSQTADPSGITGTVLLAESHMAIHTWPELKSVTLDVYVCNVSSDNSQKASDLMEGMIRFFAPAHRDCNLIERGSPKTRLISEGSDLIEPLTNQVSQRIHSAKRIASTRSPHQDIEVFDTVDFGKLLRIDGYSMTSERDEFLYHEALIHPIATSHEAPKSALIIGGGDGGATEELLKHPSIESITLVELDEAVIDMSRKHLQHIHGGSFSNPRVTVLHQDGRQFIETTEARFDLIYLDITDPGTPADSLYSLEFFESAKRRLQPGGALSLHLGSPFFHPDRARQAHKLISRVFKIVRVYTVYVPIYGSLWCMATASDTVDPNQESPQDINKKLSSRNIKDLDLYCGKSHLSLFTLPKYMQNMLANSNNFPNGANN